MLRYCVSFSLSLYLHSVFDPSWVSLFMWSICPFPCDLSLIWSVFLWSVPLYVICWFLCDLSRFLLSLIMRSVSLCVICHLSSFYVICPSSCSHSLFMWSVRNLICPSLCDLPVPLCVTCQSFFMWSVCPSMWSVPLYVICLLLWDLFLYMWSFFMGPGLLYMICPSL